MNKLLWLRLSSEKRGIQEGDDLPHAPFIFRMKKQIQTVGMILLHSLSLTPFRTMVPQSLSSNKDGISAVLSAMEAFPGNFQIQRHAFIVLRSICSTCLVGQQAHDSQKPFYHNILQANVLSFALLFVKRH